jgi:GTPase Era involved in 16S rRNA processing
VSTLLRARRSQEATSREGLERRAAGLSAALEVGGDRLDPRAAAQARQVVERVGERTSIVGSHTVVALAGATGSGKSSLFNMLVGEPVSAIGARRPTTSTPTAAIWGDESAQALLDWLKVGRRHHVPAREGVDAAQGELDLDGLVLLDLPDFDSRESAHRVEADRVLGLVDVFVWVTDPQKYADARLHDEYLTALAGHDAVTLVVLNQADRLSVDDAEACAADLKRLLAADGVKDVEVFLTSATTSAGVVSLEHRISTVVKGHHAAEQRLVADVRASAERLREGVAEQEVRLGNRADQRLVEALGRAAGIPTVLAAVERDYRRSATAHTGWPFTRWARGLRPDPLKRLRLDRSRDRKATVSATDVRLVLGRSSLPPASPAARSAVDLATRDLGDRAGEGLPDRWAEAAQEAASPPDDRMADALDQAVMQTSLRGRTPWWWSIVGLLQWLLAAVAVAGLVWLLVLMAMGWLQLPEVDTPQWGPLPYPLLMLAGGVLIGLTLAALGRVLGRVGGRRRRRLIEKRLHEAIDTVARERIVAPVQQVLTDHRETREQLQIARG